MDKYDLCILWNWEYDAELVALFKDTCALQNLSVVEITPDNIEEMINALNDRKIDFRVFFDRASEDDRRFVPFVQWAMENNTFYINNHDQARRSWNKATMHYALINAGIYTPYTAVLPSYEAQKKIMDINLGELGNPFVVKPIQGSGGEGVVMGVTSLDEVNKLRQDHPKRIYLLQTHIIPRTIDNRPAWFRVIYCRERIYACWWDTDTHIYIPVKPHEESQFGLESIFTIMKSIAEISGLDLFSTEIAHTENGRFVVVDYVNDQPDLRMQSAAQDGVPDFIVRDTVDQLVRLVSDHV